MNHSRTRKVLLCTASTLEILLFAGPIYGWACLVPVLIEDGYFSEGCATQVQLAVENRTNMSVENTVCPSQEKKLNLAFTLATSCLAALQFPLGFMADRFSTRSLRILGSLMFAVSGFLWIFSSKDLSNLIYSAVVTLNISGFLLYFPLFQVTNRILATNKSLVLSIFSGGYDSSAIVFLLFREFHHLGLGLKQIFSVYSTFGTVFAIILTLFIPLITKNTENNNEYWYLDEKRDNNDNSSTQNGRKLSDELRSLTDTDAKEIIFKNDTSFKSQITTITFFLQSTFVSLTNLHLMFYIGSINNTLAVRFKCDQKTANWYLTIFGLLQFLGLLVSPVIGPILDGAFLSRKERTVYERKFLGSVFGLIVTNSFHIMFTVAVMVPYIGGQYVAFGCHIVLRAFLFAAHFSIMANFGDAMGFILLQVCNGTPRATFDHNSLKSFTRYPKEHYGKLASLILFFSGLISLLQYLMFEFIEQVLDGDPFWVDAGFLIASILLNIYPYKLYRIHKERMLKQSSERV